MELMPSDYEVKVYYIDGPYKNHVDTFWQDSELVIFP